MKCISGANKGVCVCWGGGGGAGGVNRLQIITGHPGQGESKSICPVLKSSVG